MCVCTIQTGSSPVSSTSGFSSVSGLDEDPFKSKDPFANINGDNTAAPADPFAGEDPFKNAVAEDPFKGSTLWFIGLVDESYTVNII